MSWDYFDREGNPITLNQYAAYFGDDEYRCVQQTTLPDGTVISTVWLGIAHGFGPTGPFIFETMIKRPDGDWAEQYRYSTEEEAAKHHRELVDLEYHANEYDAGTRWNQLGDEIE